MLAVGTEPLNLRSSTVAVSDSLAHKIIEQDLPPRYERRLKPAQTEAS